MPKFDPSLLPAIPVVRETKTFTLKGGQQITLTAQVQDGGEFAYACMDLHTQNLEKWEPGGVPTPAAPPVKITNTLCWMITRLLLVIVPGEDEDESDLWQFQHWAILASRDEKSFSAISAWASSLTDPKDEATEDPTPASPPESKGDAEHCSPAPSTTPDDTPTS